MANILPAEAVALHDLFVKVAASYYFSENKIHQKINNRQLAIIFIFNFKEVCNHPHLLPQRSEKIEQHKNTDS